MQLPPSLQTTPRACPAKLNQESLHFLQTDADRQTDGAAGRPGNGEKQVPEASWLPPPSTQSYFQMLVTDILNLIRINRILNYLLSSTRNNCLSPKREEENDEFLRYRT